jgi:predicted double-glycine peptidase
MSGVGGAVQRETRPEPDHDRGMKRKPKRASYRTIPDGAIKIDLPNATQVTDYTCGASALLAVCAYFGVGPEDEPEFVHDMGMGRGGADPIHITTAAARYGLRILECRPMSDRQLIACLDSRWPVVMMMQAWPVRRPRSYRRRWTDGHWVVAIGYDSRGIYFEDPSIHGARGFLTYADLRDRWHDIEGRGKERVHRLGIALWKDGVDESVYLRRARVID